MLRAVLLITATLAAIFCVNPASAQAADGTDAPDITSTLEQAPAHSGNFGTGVGVISEGGVGSDTSPAGTGGDGGDVTVTATTFTSNTTAVVGSAAGNPGEDSNSGRPASGGNGGNVSYTDTSAVSANELVLYSFGSDGHPTGGNSGNVTANISGTYQSAVDVSTFGGSAYTTGGNGGDGGDITMVFSGETNRLTLVSAGGSGPYLSINGGSAGDAGDISLTLRGKVGEVYIDTAAGTTNAIQGAAGTVNVRLENGAEVSQDIEVLNGLAILTLAFELASQGEVDAANTALVGAAASGSITVGSRTYHWSGFSSLVNQISVLAAQNPGATITVTSSSSSEGARPSGSRADRIAALNAEPTVVEKLRCDSRSVNVFRLSNGAIAVKVRVDGKYYNAGTLVDGKFVPAPGGSWMLTATGDGVEVAGQDGAPMASCG